MTLSIIIPAYNEEARIGPTLDKVKGYLEGKGLDGEIIVINDGSTDGTLAKLEGISELKVISFETNRGKGAAVREGLKAATGDMALMTDADLSTPIAEAGQLIEKLNDGYDMVIGSRGISDSNVEKYQPPLRLALGVAFGFAVKGIFRMSFTDTQCGFKLMRGDAAKKLAPHMKIDGFTFDVEMLALAVKMGMKVAEVGVKWSDVAGSKLQASRDFNKIVRELFQIRKNLKQFKR